MPVVGGEVAAPFDQMSSASRGLAAAGSRQVTIVHRIAWTLGLSVALIPILIVGIFYVPRRWRFVKEATAGARLLGSAAALDLFALRALTRQPLHRLAEVSADPARAWHVRDPEVIAALAALELQECGLAMPTRPS
jgi:hypothetical protein